MTERYQAEDDLREYVDTHLLQPSAWRRAVREKWVSVEAFRDRIDELLFQECVRAGGRAMTDETQHPLSPDRGPVPDDAQRYKDPDPEVDWDARNAQPDITLNLTVPLWVARRVFDTLETCSLEAKDQTRRWHIADVLGSE